MKEQKHVVHESLLELHLVCRATFDVAVFHYQGIAGKS